MKGLLCSDICVPTPGSYYCKCREGFTLLEDGKTCRQDLPTDRYRSFIKWKICSKKFGNFCHKLFISKFNEIYDETFLKGILF